MGIFCSQTPQTPQARGCPGPEPLLGLEIGVTPGTHRHSPAARGLPGSCTKRLRIPPPVPSPPPGAPPVPSPSPSRAAAAAADMARPLSEGLRLNRQSAPSFFSCGLSAARLLVGGGGGCGESGAVGGERCCWGRAERSIQARAIELRERRARGHSRGYSRGF